MDLWRATVVWSPPMPERRDPAPEDSLSGAPLAGRSYPTFLEVQEQKAKLRAEDTDIAKAEELQAEVMHQINSLMNRLLSLGPAHAIVVDERLARSHFNKLERVHTDGGDLGRFARERLVDLVHEVVAKLDDLADDRSRTWSAPAHHPAEVPYYKWSSAMLKEVVEEETHWPVLLNLTGESIEAARDRCRHLNVGARSGLELVPKTPAGANEHSS